MHMSDSPTKRFPTEAVLSIATLMVVGLVCLTFQHVNLKKKAAVKAAAVPSHSHHVAAKAQRLPAGQTRETVAEEEVKEKISREHFEQRLTDVD